MHTGVRSDLPHFYANWTSGDTEMPIEKKPQNPLPANYVPPAGAPYKVNDGDDWASVAQHFKVEVDTLIRFNFQTRDPAEVNWYLKHNVGCRKPSPGGNNW